MNPAALNNAARFLGKVADYERYRERYDPELILPLLRTWCGLSPTWRIADVGAGTGMLAEIFLHNGNSVAAVEPNDEMRLAAQRLHHAHTSFHIFAGSAEATTLPNASVEMVAVGRALHWFHLPAALPEFKRILVPGGWITAIVMGRLQQGTPANDAFEHLLRTVTEAGRSSHAGYGVYRELQDHCTPGSWHRCEFFRELQLPWRQFTAWRSRSPTLRCRRILDMTSSINVCASSSRITLSTASSRSPPATGSPPAVFAESPSALDNVQRQPRLAGLLIARLHVHPRAVHRLDHLVQ